MRRRPAQILALLLVIWIVVVVFLPTIDLPRTTLPARSTLWSAGFVFMPVASLAACLPCIAAAIVLQTCPERVVLGPASLIDLTCSRLC